MIKEEFEIPIDQIKIGERARSDLGDIESLQKSIERVGQLQAIILKKEDGSLLAGFRRLTCCRNLGFKMIRAVYIEDLSEAMQKVVEHDENLHKTLTWYEQAKLRYEIHFFLQEEHGAAVKGHKTGRWSQKDTANYLGISVGALSEDMTLIETIKVAPKLTDFSTKKQALKSITKIRELAVLTKLAEIDSEEDLNISEGARYQVFEGNATDILKEKLEDEVIDLIIFDPPWGIEIDKIGVTGGGFYDGTTEVTYDDSFEASQNLVFELMPELFRVLKNNSHMYMFVGYQYAAFYVNYLQNLWQVSFENRKQFFVPYEKGREWAFDVEYLPLIWVKNGGSLTNTDYKFMSRYEVILFCQKGSRILNYPVSNVFERSRPPTLSRIHPQQKSTELIRDFIKISTTPDSLILDPCAGSGASVIAALTSGRKAIAIEQNHDSFLKMKNWIQGFKKEETE